MWKWETLKFLVPKFWLQNKDSQNVRKKNDCEEHRKVTPLAQWLYNNIKKYYTKLTVGNADKQN